MPRKSVPPPLHELEAEVMNAMWELQSATVREVMDFCNANAERARAYTTYMTIMARLDKKGLLRRRREGKTDVYRTRLEREQYRERRAEADGGKPVGGVGGAPPGPLARPVGRGGPPRA